VSKELLRKSPLFAGLEEEDLERLYNSARHIKLAPGDVLIAEGADANEAYLAITGEFDVTRRSGDREFVIDRRVAGEFMGEIGLLENAQRTATVRAATEAEILEITRETFHELLRKCPDAAIAVLQTVAARLRHSEATLRQSEKMAALGTLSAGLAHELNNPAAAVQRSAAQFREALATLQRCAAALAHERFSAAQIALIEGLQAQLPARLAQSDDRKALALCDAESELQDWLEALGIDDAWDVAPPIVRAGWSLGDFAALSGGFASRQQAVLARWLSAAIVAFDLLETVSQGADRIAEIVSAVKSYAYLDRGPVQLLDVHEGLDNTLMILQHRLKQGVEVVREYDRTLPRIEAYGGELNQVWTNLLDNAIDAMDGHGTLRIRTYATQNASHVAAVAVEISDTGSGIPPAIHDRIFDAFFTTKEPGKGSGLGLHIAYSIINLHRGEITVESEPGETTFKLTLPLQM
jgi:signal transduction histidine kinase